MKHFEMERYFENEYRGKAKFNRISRWITVRNVYRPSKRNALYEYFARDDYGNKPGDTDFNPDETNIDFFRFGGKTYAIEQFYALGSMWVGDRYCYTENGEKHWLSGVDMYGDLYYPLYIELDEYGEKVRVYEMER